MSALRAVESLGLWVWGKKRALVFGRCLKALAKMQQIQQLLEICMSCVQSTAHRLLPLNSSVGKANAASLASEPPILPEFFALTRSHGRGLSYTLLLTDVVRSKRVMGVSARRILVEGVSSTKQRILKGIFHCLVIGG